MTEDRVEMTIRRALLRPARPSSDFDLNHHQILPPGVLPKTRVLRDAGVLVAIWLRPGGARVILTQRSPQLKHHPGQVAFAGGKVDAHDDGPIAAALREAHEEIALPPDHVDVLGTLPAHETVTGFRVLPVLGLIRDDFTPKAEAGEVAEIFTVPLSHVLDRSRYRIEERQWQGVTRKYYTVPWGPYYIWGATARMLRALAEQVAAEQAAGEQAAGDPHPQAAR